MCGMYLASHQVGHHGAHWFAVTVRVNAVFTERKVVCIVNEGFTPAAFFSSDRRVSMRDHFVLWVSPEVVSVSTEFSFFTKGVSSVLLLRYTGLFFFNVHWIKWPYCVVDVYGDDAEQVWEKTCLEFTSLRFKVFKGISFIVILHSELHSFILKIKLRRSKICRICFPRASVGCVIHCQQCVKNTTC